MRTATLFRCGQCDAQAPKWMGRCLECGAWGTMSEELRKENRELSNATVGPGKTVSFNDLQATGYKLQATGIAELDRVLGGGIAPGAVILLAGEPGVGKSTLVAHIADRFVKNEEDAGVLYVSGEESPEQLKARFGRMGLRGRTVKLLTDTTAEVIVATMRHEEPALVIVDSVQTVRAEAADGRGALTQLQAGSALLTEAAKATRIPLLLIGQITKTNEIAGPKRLEHLVDVVLTFEGDGKEGYRMLRASKNRFGRDDEVGIFNMTSRGLEEVQNPSAALLAHRSHEPGSVATCLLEGNRPLLLELQALATRSSFPYPERRTSGLDKNRLTLLLAVLEKIAPKLKVHDYNIHVNVTGGLRIREPAADLAVILAVVSSVTGRAIPHKTLTVGEVGLGGELRAVPGLTRRTQEAHKLGFTSCLVPALDNSASTKGLIPCATVQDAITFLKLS